MTKINIEIVCTENTIQCDTKDRDQQGNLLCVVGGQSIPVIKGDGNKLLIKDNNIVGIQMDAGEIESMAESSESSYSYVLNQQKVTLTPLKCNGSLCAAEKERYFKQNCQKMELPPTEPEDASASPSAGSTREKLEAVVKDLVTAAWKYKETENKFKTQNEYENALKKNVPDVQNQKMLLESYLVEKWIEIAIDKKTFDGDPILKPLFNDIVEDYNSLKSTGKAGKKLYVYYGKFAWMLDNYISAVQIDDKIKSKSIDCEPKQDFKGKTVEAAVKDLVTAAWKYKEMENNFKTQEDYENALKKSVPDVQNQKMLLESYLVEKWIEIAIDMKTFDGDPILKLLFNDIVEDYNSLKSTGKAGKKLYVYYGKFAWMLGISVSPPEIEAKLSPSSQGEAVLSSSANTPEQAGALEVLDVLDMDMLMYGDLIAKGYTDNDITWLLAKGYTEELLCELPDKNIYIDVVLLSQYSFSSIGELNQALEENVEQINKSYALNYASEFAVIEEVCLKLASLKDVPVDGITPMDAAQIIEDAKKTTEQVLKDKGYSDGDIEYLNKNYLNKGLTVEYIPDKKTLVETNLPLKYFKTSVTMTEMLSKLKKLTSPSDIDITKLNFDNPLTVIDAELKKAANALK